MVVFLNFTNHGKYGPKTVFVNCQWLLITIAVFMHLLGSFLSTTILIPFLEIWNGQTSVHHQFQRHRRCSNLYFD